MKRDLSALAENTYDLLIIGGGIYGACVAWDATLRGLSVVLVEKADFGSATSANSLKIIHGGLRYLQHADFRRMRESIRERTTLMRIAPHLVHPLPVLIPTYGHGMQGKELFSLALLVNDLISFDRNRLNDPQKHIPRGRVISRREVVQLLPGIYQHGLTGGAVFYDSQVYNSERLLISFLRSAEQAGADLANYVEVTAFLKNRDAVNGIEAKDVLTGNRFDIRSRAVVNTCGPWVNRVLGLIDGYCPKHSLPFAKAINLITRPLFQTYAVGVSEKNGYRDADSVINKGNRLLFITPWRGHSLIGTAYAIYDGDPEVFKVTEKDIQNFLNEINKAYPSAGLKLEDILFVHSGLLPSRSVYRETDSVQLAKQHRIHDHRQEGIKGLISVVGVKYTTARHVAEKAVDLVFESWGQKPPGSISSTSPIYGGDIEEFGPFLRAEINKKPYGLEEKEINRLVCNYGSTYSKVFRYLNLTSEGLRMPVNDPTLLKAEVLHGVREEMALKLSDVILRRTELGTAGYPGDETLRTCADIMAKELGWNQERVRQELQETNDYFGFTHLLRRGNGPKLAGAAV